MENDQMAVIKQLMEQLEQMMGPSEDDFNSRLGREKPDMAIMKVEAGGDDGMEGDMDGEMDMGEECGPEESLKKRLMKLRG